MDNPTPSQPTATNPNVHQSLPAAPDDQPDSPTRVNQHLGNYRLLQRLGSGGFAEVYLGEHIHLGTHAAIKILKGQLADDDLELFRKEARTIARLHHPYIISILDFAIQDTTPFLVLDYAPNGSLRHLHPRGTIIAPSTALLYVTQIAEALQYAHDQHLIHRDVKPENMLLGWRKEILLSDFGISVVLQTSHSDMRHAVIGTVPYMSPEQFSGKVLPASDQYALAVVAYEWLCGSLPFHGSFVEMAVQHASMPPASLSARNSLVSPTLEQVIFRALAKEPSQRYPSVSEFARAWASASAHQVILSSTLSGENHVAVPVDHQADTIVATVYAGQGTVGPENAQEVLLQPVVEKKSGAPSYPHRPLFSRRAVLLGLSGLASVGIAGAGLLWFVRTRPLPPKPQPTPTVAPLPTPGTLLSTYQGHNDSVTALAWSSSEEFIVSASKDHTVRIWATDSGTAARTYTGHSDAVNAVAWSPDNQSIASASSDATVQVWSALKGDNPVVTYKGHTDLVNAVSWSPSSDAQSQNIASGGNDKVVHIWNPNDGTDITTYSKHTDIIYAVVWSPDGKYLASAGSDKTVQVWDPTKANDDSQPIVNFQHHSDVVRAVAWSPDEQSIASAGDDNTVYVWLAVIGGNPLLSYTNHSAAVNAVAWSPDGKRIASASDDGAVRVWSASDGSDIFSYSPDGTNPVYAVAWSPDGKYLASAGADKTLQIYSA